MSSGDARRSQSVISLNVIKKQGETSTQRSTKRLREDAEHLTSEILKRLQSFKKKTKSIQKF